MSLDKNGLELSYVGATCYLGASYGCNYATNGEFVFIAFVHLDEDDQMLLDLKSHMIHLGYFADVRDAAYTAQYFCRNIASELDVLAKVGQGNYSVQCPVWQHSAEETAESLVNMKRVRQTYRKQPKTPRIRPPFDTKLADNAIERIYDFKIYKIGPTDTTTIIAKMKPLYEGGMSYKLAATEIMESYKS